AAGLLPCELENGFFGGNSSCVEYSQLQVREQISNKNTATKFLIILNALTPRSAAAYFGRFVARK
ncbi:hypothetical protein, partial [Microbulbifer aggregans]|uniref:hypothetical protein n=1 Tax=Microbulbifer aggregans TaxID=1769779 RepID=UPI001CFEBEA9